MLQFQIILQIQIYYNPNNFIQRLISFPSDQESSMDYNRFSYYRANPYANNDFIPIPSMVNRKKKQFVSQMPQGQQHYPSKSGKKIFKDKIQKSQIDHQHILQSPQRYPFQNRIALDKTYRRNLDTIDIEGAASGTKVSQSVRNKHKALIQLQKQNKLPQTIRQLGVGQSLDEVYEQKRRQLAQKLNQTNERKQSQLKKSFISLGTSQQRQKNNQQKSQDNSNINNKLDQLNKQYNRYVNLNSNQKYVNHIPPNAFQYEGFQRYKRPQRSYSTIDRNNHNQNYRNNNVSRNLENSQNQRPNQNQTLDNEVGYNRSKQIGTIQNPSYPQRQNQQQYKNAQISINNRYKSNPQYADNYSYEHNKRLNQLQRNRTINDGLKDIYKDRKQFRRNNPTNLSFNLAGQNALNSLY